MATRSSTPIDIVESFFDVKLERSGLKRFDGVSNDDWHGFALHYLQVMRENFAPQFLAVPDGGEAPLRLYFEPRMREDWDAAVRRLYSPTPLLGVIADPGPTSEITRADVSRMLAPLKKHLLVADSVYVRDSFYYCFDRMVEEPSLLDESVRKLKAWLPILIELRDLIEARALVFMPYYITPSFPYGGTAPGLSSAREKLRMRARSGADAGPPEPLRPNLELLRDPEALARAAARVPQGPHEQFNETEVMGAWLNARLMGLDPVFPTRAMFDWAARLQFDDDSGPRTLTSDLISLGILPFGRAEGIALSDLMELRKNEDVFHHVRRVVVACKEHLEAKLEPGTPREAVSLMCDSFIRERLEEYERRSILRFVAEQPIAGIAVSLAVGAALLPVAPLIAVGIGAIANPQLLRLAQERWDPKRRAIGHLQALL